MAESQWASEVSTLQSSQRREYRDCVMKLHEQAHLSSSVNAAANPTYRYFFYTPAAVIWFWSDRISD